MYDLDHNLVKNSMKGHTNYVWSLVFNRSQRYLFSGGNDCSVKIWDLKSKFRLLHSIDHGTSVLTISVSFRNDYIFYAGSRYQPSKKVSMKKILVLGPAKTEEKKVKKKKKGFSFFKKKKKDKKKKKKEIWIKV